MGIIDYMLSVFRGLNLTVREYGNGIIFPLCVVLAVVLARYIWQSYMDDPRGWRNKPGMDTAIVFWWIFFAEGIRAGAAWAVLSAQNDNEPLVGVALNWASFGFTLGVLILICVSLRCIFIFTNTRRNASVLLAFSFVAIAAFLLLGNLAT